MPETNINGYVATDDDLPDIFWQESKRLDLPVNNCMSEKSHAVAVLLHYPEIRISKSQQRRRAAALRSEREFSLTERKVFVKLSKKCQMWDWLKTLFDGNTIGQIRAKQGDKTVSFLTQLYAKFYRYTPYKIKWITEKQYQWTKHIACQYIKVPE